MPHLPLPDERDKRKALKLLSSDDDGSGADTAGTPDGTAGDKGAGGVQRPQANEAAEAARTGLVGEGGANTGEGDLAKPDTSLDLTDLKSGTTLKEFWENAKKALEQTGADLAGLPRPGAELEKFEGYSVRPEVADLVERIGPVMPEEEASLRKRIQNVLKDDLKGMEAFQRELRIVLEDGEMDPEIRINLLAWGDEFGAEIRKWIRGPVIEIIGKPD